MNIITQKPQEKSSDLPIVVGRLLGPRQPFTLKVRFMGKRKPRIVGINENHWSVVVDCPYCGGQHRHGWDIDEKDPGRNRNAHCTRGGEYRIYLEGEPRP